MGSGGSHGGTVYFSADDGVHGFELWRSDGTRNGTRLVKDIIPGELGLHPRRMEAVGETLFFTGYDPDHGGEVWTSDGTATGTHLVVDLIPGPESSFPRELTSVGSLLYFVASREGLDELWTTDGTVDGTHLLTAFEPSFCQDPGWITDVAGVAYLASCGRLWRSDGTAAGTSVVRRFRPVNSIAPLGLTDVDGTLYFGTTSGGAHPEDHPPAFWRSDGTATGTLELMERGPVSIVGVGGIAYFVTYEGTEDFGFGLWRSDGSTAGTEPVAFPIAFSYSYPQPTLVAVGDLVYFAGDDDRHGSELWFSDGTQAGTGPVGDIEPGASGSSPDQLVSVSDGSTSPPGTPTTVASCGRWTALQGAPRW